MARYITHAEFTCIGDRQVNEDSAGVKEAGEKNCFVMCDGLGGHGMGDVASSMVVDYFTEHFEQVEDATEFLKNAFEGAQKQLLDEQQKRNTPKKMKTTVTAMVTDKKKAYIGHVGDSRVYVFRKNKVLERTLDHSIPQMLVMSGEIKESEIRNHPDRNILLRVMGAEWDGPAYEFLKPVPLRKCQAMLLCSDGFWELIDEACMCDCLKKSNSVEEWLAYMSEIVKINGKDKDMDNYTAVAVWVNK